jgi:hypothetical protein
MSKIGQGDFRRCWEAAGSDGEVLEKFALQFKRLEDAVAAVLEFLGMVPMDGTGTVPAVHRPSHICNTNCVYAFVKCMYVCVCVCVCVLSGIYGVS